MAVPSKADQTAEGTARELTAKKLGVQPGEGEGALDVVDDVVVDIVQPAAPPPAPEAEPSLPTPRADKKRDEIISRFRADRTAREEEERDEITEFARTNALPPEFQPPAPPEPTQADAPGEDADPAEVTPAAEPEPEPLPTATTVKVKVNGEERELSLDQVIAKAQIALASEGILDEVKSLKKHYEGLVGQPNVARPDQHGHHAEPNRTQSPETDPPAAPTAADPNQDDEFGKLIETIQFGDPAEAKTLLAQTIGRAVAEAVPKVVSTALQSDRLKDEGARTAKVLKDFEQSHPELAKDPMARAVIERRIYDLQVEDIRKLGVDPAAIGNGAPAVIADAHKYYRANGFAVRLPSQMLQQATDDFLEWKGVAKTNEPAPPATRGTPRIDVDRSARRAAIPQQPSRTAAPRAVPAPTAPAPRDRSQIVQTMARTRMQPRNRGAA
jgi:hypothetical protein